MKLIINREILLENLNNVGKALSSRNIIPALNGIMFELNDEGLKLIATNNDITIENFIDKKDIKDIKETGKVIIIGRLLIDVLRKLGSEFISMESLDGNKVIIIADTFKCNINCYDVNDFPDIEIETNDNKITIASDILKEMFTTTIFAVSTQEIRPILTGVNIKLENGMLECVATDSYRLSKNSLKYDENIEKSINIVVPARNINELIKILETNEDCEIYFFENKVVFKYKNLLFQSSLLNGSFPNTSNSISNDFDITLTINLKNFYNMIDRASLLNLSKEKNNLQMELKKNKLIINSFSDEVGKIEEVINVDNPNNKTINISFSSKYMMEALKNYSDDNIMMNMNGSIKPIIIKGTKQTNLLQLILPIKTF